MYFSFLKKQMFHLIIFVNTKLGLIVSLKHLSQRQEYKVQYSCEEEQNLAPQYLTLEHTGYS